MSEQVKEMASGTDANPDTDTVAGPDQPARISWAPVPRVNLLPIEIIEKRNFRRMQMVLASAVLGVVAIAAAGTVLVQRDVGAADDQLTRSLAAVAAAQTQSEQYAAVPAVIAQVDKARAARTTAMGGEVLWYRYLNDIDGARPAGVELNSIVATTNSPGGTAAGVTGSSNVLIPNGIGSVKLDGSAAQYDEISTWLENLDKITGISASELQSATAGGQDAGLTFSSAGVIDSDALSHRYDQKAG